MKSIFLFLSLWIGHSAFAQNTEFNILGNGLIYSDETIKPLKKIVDSLNLKFKVCDLNTTYLSQMQNKAHYVYLLGEDANKAKLDMDNHISFKDFIKKYPNIKNQKELLIIKYSYQYMDYDTKTKQHKIMFSSVGADEFSTRIKIDYTDKKLKNTWVYNYSEKSKYSEEYLVAFYFTEEFSSKTIPYKYARMIQYSNCMIDTTSRILYSGEDFDKNNYPQIEAFTEYVNKITNKPKDPVDDNHTPIDYYDKYDTWDSLRFSLIDKARLKNKKFDILLENAVKELQEKNPTLNRNELEEFEEYVRRYHSKKAELEIKRRRRVIGGCSQDDGPRLHALSIAKLSAETAYWKVFLRAHLDIMNDRFERMSDGSYAWEGRQTYIKELELLNIDVKSLLLGITFRMENASKNHYYGDVGRLGRALSESHEAKAVSTAILEIIADKELDDYNRVIMCYLFISYNDCIKDDKVKEQNKKCLNIALKTLPDYLFEEMALLNK
ncbi:MAG: hypothetical protein MUC49_18645 [Raineya sp.]|jgi:hypothetical protein|nr:hypothetical protein [Raineya sp.]